MNTLVTILLTVFVFGFLIFVHEFGHYIFARIFKVAINEFAIGMGPKIFSRQSKKTGIVYSVRLFPIGGFVSMVGEDGDCEIEGALSSKPKWQRFIVLFAGAFVNLVFGFIFMACYVISSPALGSTVVADFSDDALSVVDGLQAEDEIVSVNGDRVHILYELSYAISDLGGESADIEVIRDGERITLSDVDFPTQELSGVTFSDMDFRVYAVEKSIGNICYHAYYQSISSVKMVWDSLIGIISGRYGVEAVSGPVGTADVIGDAASAGFSSFMMLFSILAINLGIMNLLPIPALDGGRILFLLIEAVRRKPIKAEIEGVINFVCIMLLFGFMLFITVKDIIGLF
ncbi:MAG: site-2 protease family protein [Clostridia bacterium]|nr:site-2 protease family protein [Clostridia bacterium]